MKNIFTIDTEDWYHANFTDNLFSNDGSLISTVEKNVDTYLEIFEKNNVKATFFVLGYVAETHGELIKRIFNAGHEIASHGYGHELVYKQTPKDFYDDVYKSKILLEDLIGKSVLGYRAPSWSITEESLWALDVLEELGFVYNSSIFPTKNFLYGIPYAPRHIHGCDVYGKGNLNLINIPPSTIGFCGKNIPFSGGAYFRVLPYAGINFATKRVNSKENKPVVFYLHPREIDPKQPRLKLSLKESIIHYTGIKGCERKLEKVLKNYDFDTIENLLKSI